MDNPNPQNKKLIDVYPYCIEGNNVEFLLFKRSTDVIYPGQWRMIGGKVKENETRSRAGLREFREETGGYPLAYWSVPLVNTFYEHQTDTIQHVVAFGAELPKDREIVLNYEHETFAWFSAGEAGKHLLWPRQIEIVTWMNDILLQNRISEDWLIDTISE